MTAYQLSLETSALFQKACSLEKDDQPECAKKIYKKIIEIMPNHMGASLNFANILIHQKNYVDAIPLYRGLSQSHPEHIKFTETLCELYQAIGSYDKAVTHYKLLIRQPEAQLKHFHLLSNVYIKLDDLPNAIGCLFWALSINENNYTSLISLAAAFTRLGQIKKAINFYEKAHLLHPQKREAGFFLGKSLFLDNQFKKALATYEKIKPGHTDQACILENIGKCQLELEQPEDAKKNLLKCVHINPNAFSAHYHLGNLYAAIGNYKLGANHFEKALGIKPDLSEAKYNLALCNLSQGNYRNGLELYSWRWNIKEYAKDLLKLPYPLWDGTMDKSLKLVVWDEQGIGDTIFFSQGLRQLNESQLKVTLLCEARMIPIFERSFPNIACYPKPSSHNTNLFSPSEFDAQIPIGDLNYYYVELDGQKPVKKLNAFIKADNKKSRQFKKNFQNKIAIGLNWRTSGKKNAAQRSIDLAQWSELISAFPEVTWVNVQYRDDNIEFSELMKKLGADHFYDAQIDALKDMDAFCAQIDALDALISIDNSTAHLAGAMGKPCFLLASDIHDWRWHTTSDQCQWYKNMQIFKKKSNNWQQTFTQVSLRLGELLKGLKPKTES